MINVAILGYGTVGSGVFEVLNENKESISRRAGQELHVKYVLDLRDFPGQPVEKVLVHDYEQIVSDPEVDIVVEVMGLRIPLSKKHFWQEKMSALPIRLWLQSMAAS